MSKYSSDKEMQKLFEGLRNVVNEKSNNPLAGNPLGGDNVTMAPDESPEEWKKRSAKAKADAKANAKANASVKPTPEQLAMLNSMGTLVDKDGSSVEPKNPLAGSQGTLVDKDGSSADMMQKKAKAFDQVEGALKQLLKKIQDAGL